MSWAQIKRGMWRLRGRHAWVTVTAHSDHPPQWLWVLELTGARITERARGLAYSLREAKTLGVALLRLYDEIETDRHVRKDASEEAR